MRILKGCGEMEKAPVRCFFTPYSKARGVTVASGIRIFVNILKLKFSEL